MPLTYRGRWSVLALTGLVLAQTALGFGAGNTPLVEAIKGGDAKTVRALLAQKGTDVNAQEADGTTPLHWAAEFDQPEVVELLIRAGAKAAVSNRYGVTPLWVASINGNAVIVERLLTAGADPNVLRADSGEAPLMMAARSGRPDVVRLLLAHGAKVNARERVRKQTALMWAALEKQAAVVRLLAEGGADVTLRSSTGLTALMFAIRAGDVETTRAMLDAGANVHDIAPAVMRTDNDQSGMIFGDPLEPEGTTMLGLAIVNARFDVAALLLERGANPNAKDSHGYPLHMLAFLRRAENRGLATVVPRVLPTTGVDSLGLARLLLMHGADINARLDWAEDPKKKVMLSSVRIPRDMALGVYSVSFVGATPFYVAAAMSDIPFMRFLAANGANATIPTRQKITPMMIASGFGYYVGEHPGTPSEGFEAVKLTFELGNDPKAVADFSEYKGGNASLDGATALHGAVKRGSVDMVQWLIDQGVPLDGKTKAGKTALDLVDIGGIAAYREAEDIAALLRRLMVERGLPVPPAPVNALPEARAGGRQ